MAGETIRLSVARRRLAMLWLIVAGMLMLLLIVQTAAGKYGSEVKRAWGWFMPSVIPTLTLIIGTIAFQATQSSTGELEVDRFSYRTAIATSAFYLTILVGTVLLQPLVAGSALSWLELSNLWLGPLQGVTVLAVSVFFQRKAA